jgi:hypothetical protein
MRKLLLLGGVVFLLSGGLSAQTLLRSSLDPTPLIGGKAANDCSAGIVIDDSSFEDGYGFNEFLASASIAQAVDLPAGNNQIDGVCICWSQLPDFLSDPLDPLLSTNVNIWAADGPGGSPGTLLSSTPFTFVSVPLISSTFYHVPIPGVKLKTSRIFVGPTWSPLLENSNFYVCADQNGPNQGVAYHQTNISGWAPYGPTEQYRTLGIRVEASKVVDPVPPPGSWLTVADLPGYQFKVRINGGSLGTQVTDCVPETLCVAGAIPTRAELFLRIIGPRPNGYLWAEAVRFTISHLEIWAQRLSTSETRYYDLPAVSTDSATLPGLVDNQAFHP